jgi:hypothetical protein
LREKGNELVEQLRELIVNYNKFGKEHPDVRSAEFKSRFIRMDEALELMIQGFYNPPVETGNQSRETYYSLRNKSVEFMISIVREELARMKAKLEGNK